MASYIEVRKRLFLLDYYHFKIIICKFKKIKINSILCWVTATLDQIRLSKLILYASRKWETVRTYLNQVKLFTGQESNSVPIIKLSICIGFF